MALKGLGYRNDHPVIVEALKAVRDLVWTSEIRSSASRVGRLTGTRHSRPKRCSTRGYRATIRRCRMPPSG